MFKAGLSEQAGGRTFLRVVQSPVRMDYDATRERILDVLDVEFPAIEAALRALRRHGFVPEGWCVLPYVDRTPLGEGATISASSIVTSIVGTWRSRPGIVLSRSTLEATLTPRGWPKLSGSRTSPRWSTTWTSGRRRGNDLPNWTMVRSQSGSETGLKAGPRTRRPLPGFPGNNYRPWWIQSWSRACFLSLSASPTPGSSLPKSASQAISIGWIVGPFNSSRCAGLRPVPTRFDRDRKRSRALGQ